MGEKKDAIKKLTVEDILSCVDVKPKEVFVPEWDGNVTIQGFTKARQQQLRKDAAYGGEIDTDRLEMLMFINGVIEPEFTKDHYEQLREKSASAIDTVLKELMVLSGLSEDEVKGANQTFRAQ